VTHYQSFNSYGQTGAGKSFSMFGLPDQETRGIIPRSVDAIVGFSHDIEAAYKEVLRYQIMLNFAKDFSAHGFY